MVGKQEVIRFFLFRPPAAHAIAGSLLALSVQVLVWRSEPMNNRDIQAAWKYHDDTKHSYRSLRDHPHFLDWANRPLPFKIYPQIEPIPLPQDVPQIGVAALAAISEQVHSSRADSIPGIQDLACILYFSAGITKQRSHPGQRFRKVPSAHRVRP
jgi:hypothetical protein